MVDTEIRIKHDKAQPQKIKAKKQNYITFHI